MLLIYEPRTTA